MENVAKLWQEWDNRRSEWKQEKETLKRHLFATSTRDLTDRGEDSSWFNSTVIPKLTQIYDNLKANYMAALFPNSGWLEWDAKDTNEESKEKARIIEGYMEVKLRESGFEKTVEKIIDDFIIYGNCFGFVEYETKTVTDALGNISAVYSGPVLKRISPLDIVFDPKATDFESTAKILRIVMTLDDFMLWAARNPVIDDNKVKKYIQNRKNTSAHEDPAKNYTREDTGGNVQENTLAVFFAYYPSSDGNGRMFSISLEDGTVLAEGRNPSWLGQDPIVKAGWRNRPDTLWAMGPLDNLVGMQYRISHLENLRADVFDQVALPMLVVKGGYEDFNYRPGEIIHLHDDGQITYLSPDTTALNADTQIAILEQKMEEMAGAPKMAMGFRTPGEKTAFEVQTLMTAASRIFQNKIYKFEREFLEPVLNLMLEVARRNMVSDELVFRDTTIGGAKVKKTISKEDIQAVGKLYPKGSRHFEEKMRRAQNLMNLLQFKQIPDVGVHLSGKKIAQMVAEDIEEEELFGENIAVKEQIETQATVQDEQVNMMEKLQAKAELGV